MLDDFKKMKVNNRLCNVVSLSEYDKHRDLYNPRFTAIESNGYVYPIKNKNDPPGPGIYYEPNAMVVKIDKTTDPRYSAVNIIDYSKARDINDILNNNVIIADIMKEVMVNGDNVLHLKVSPQDSPVMAALKNSINAKMADKRDYEDRFEQYQNDMRLLRGTTITLRKLIEICTAFDINVSITLSDVPGCPNPMGDPIVANLTGGNIE